MSKELLDNVSTIETAIKYLKGNHYIKDDCYSMEALYYIEKALKRAKKVEELLGCIKRDLVFTISMKIKIYVKLNSKRKNWREWNE